MASRAMAFYFKITYDDGHTDTYWSKPWHMALWERKNKGRSFLPGDGMPSIDSLFWLAFRAGRDAQLFDDKLMDEWGARIESFEFSEDDDNGDNEEADDAADEASLDPTQTED